MGGAPDERELTLAAALGLLTERQREVLDLHINGGWTVSQIAEFLGMSRQAVRQCKNRGLATIERALRGKPESRTDRRLAGNLAELALIARARTGRAGSPPAEVSALADQLIDLLIAAGPEIGDAAISRLSA